MLKIKPGVSLKGVQPQVLPIMLIAAAIYQGFGLDAVVTSGTDGRHREGSLHYRGLALDLRSNNLTAEQAASVGRQLRAALGAEYDVVIEGDHIHVEFDPK